MAAKEDGESASQEGDQRIMDLALQAVCKGTSKGKWTFGKGQNWNEKRVAKGQRHERRKRARKGWQGRFQLSIENSHISNPKKTVEVKDKWVKVRVTMDSGAAGHVMPETMFPRVKLVRKTTRKKFVAASGEQIKDLGDKTIPFKTNEGTQRCITFRSANVVNPLISMQKVVQAGEHCGAG